MKKVFRVLIILLAVCVINITFTTSSQAISDVIGAGDNWVQQGKQDQSGTIDTDKLHETSNLLYNVLLTIGIAIALIMGTILGIKFMVASVDEKAKIKETFIPYIVGCFIIFGAFGIWKIAMTIGNSFEG